ncbi:MAG: hypothetical protein JWN14_3716, partial [Chthonomonadales bacterium]|nr:hypothetical protein [Chthonomonadales bacterium]
RRAADTACLSNLQQTSLALSLYLSDYDGHYPTSISAVFENGSAESDKTWRDLIVSYLKTPHFPECPYDDPSVSMIANARRIDLCGYAYNARFSSAVRASNSAEYIGRNEAFLTYPSITVCLFEARPGILALYAPDTTKLTPIHGILRMDLIDDIELLSPGAYRHHGGVNYVMADGHVKWLKPTQIQVQRESDGVGIGFGL